MSAESDKVFSNIVPYLHKILVLSEEPYDKYYEKAAKYILKGTGQRNLKKKKNLNFCIKWLLLDQGTRVILAACQQGR